MTIFRGHCAGIIFTFLLSAPSTLLAQSHLPSTSSFLEKSSADYPAIAPKQTDAVIAEMIERNRLRAEELQGYSASRTYEVRNPAGKISAQAVVKLEYEAPDKKMFSKTSESGSVVVRQLVFDRLIENELDTVSGPEHSRSAITEENYVFTPDGEGEVGPYHCLIFKATPKRKEKYLFEGRIWVDQQDFAIVRITGQPAKSLSFWIKRADFVRQYEKVGGFWLPSRDETTVEVKVYGTVVFSIDHQNYVIHHSVSSHLGTAARAGRTDDQSMDR